MPFFLNVSMAITGQGMHHLNIRKRIHEKHEEFPSPVKKIRYLDRIIYIVGILGPVMSLPQILKIFLLKNADGVSFLTYSTLTVFSCVWLWYGMVHKEKPIIVTNILWIISEIVIVVGVLIYGNGFL